MTTIALIAALLLPGGQAPPDPERSPLVVPRAEGDFVLDGRLEDELWQGVDPLAAVAQEPVYGGEPGQPTSFLIAYDDRYLYFACDFGDSDPAGIRGTSLRRDDVDSSNDWCGLVLDTFNDEENSVVFGTTPAGILSDVAVSGDGAIFMDTWDTFWDVAVHTGPAGWSAEMRIPLSSIRFQTDPDGLVRMGMTALRVIGRTGETATWPGFRPRWGGMSKFKASTTADVVLGGIESRRPVYVTPYVLGGAGRKHALNEAGTAWSPDGDLVHEAGLDLKYGLTSNLTLDVTVNTDFAQVEADDQQVNLSRFSLFFPEKRLFFQERPSIFEYSLGGAERLFYSRRIGLANGEPVRIWGGARLVGRVGEWDVGFLDMQTAESPYLPSENFGVLRARRRVLNDNSYIGGIVTSRIGAHGARSLLYGLDGIGRVGSQDFVTVNWAESFDDAGREASPLDRGLARVRWERRGAVGLGYAIDAARIGDAFDPAVGFLLRSGVDRLEPSVRYGIRHGEASPFDLQAVSLAGSAWRRHEDGSLMTAQLVPGWALALKGGASVNLRVEGNYEDVRTGFGLPDGALVPADEYRFLSADMGYSTGYTRLWRLDGALGGGEYYDGWRTSVTVSPTWKPSMHLELGGSYSIDRIRFPDRGGFTAPVARLRTRVYLNRELSGSAFVQYSGVADALGANLRFRWTPRAGTDLWIVYDEGLTTDRYGRDPVAPLSTRRTLMVKYSRTLGLGW